MVLMTWLKIFTLPGYTNHIYTLKIQLNSRILNIHNRILYLTVKFTKQIIQFSVEKYKTHSFKIFFFSKGCSTKTSVRHFLRLGCAPCRLGWQGPLRVLSTKHVLHKHQIRAAQRLHRQPGVDLRENESLRIFSGLPHMRTTIWMVLLMVFFRGYLFLYYISLR